MSDPFLLAAQSAAVALGLEPTRSSAGMSSHEYLEWMSDADLNAFLRECERLMAAGQQTFTPEGQVLRRAELRRELGLGTSIAAYAGAPAWVKLRSCVEPYPRTVRKCRCAEDAIAEVAASVPRVDASAVAAARARAEVLHGRLSRRLGRARVRAARVLGVSRLSDSPPAVASRRVLGLETVGVSERFVSVRESEALPLPGRASAGRVRVSSVARGRVTSADSEGRELARKLGVEYSVSSWKALPIVDGKRSGS